VAKPRQEFLGPITKLAQDGSGVIDGYGAEIHNVTMVLNAQIDTPTTGLGRGAFWIYDDGENLLPKFTDSEGNTTDVGGGQLGSGSVTLIDGYRNVVTPIPAGAQVLWSVASLDGIPGQIQITAQSTSGFTITSSSSYDTSTLNWIWILTSTISSHGLRALTNGFINSHGIAAQTDERFYDDRVASGMRTATNIIDITSAAAPSVGQALVTVAEDAAQWMPVVTTSGKNAAANQVLWHDGVNNVWTGTPKVSALSAANGVSIGPGNCVKFETLAAHIGFLNTTSGPGNHLSITAQNSKLSGGNLNLSSGSGQTIGMVNIQAGGMNTLVVGPGYVRNNGSSQQAELSIMREASVDAHITQGYDGRTATRLMNDYGSYTVVPKAYQQSTTYAPRRDKQFGGFSITKEGVGGNAAAQVLTFGSTILGSKIPACRKIVGTFLIGYARAEGEGSSAFYLLDAYADSSGNLTVCSLTPAAQKHNGNENDVLATAGVSGASTFDITVTRPDSAGPLEVVSYYWELNYGWA